MKRIVLFRYHHQFERNKEFLRFVQYLNPGLPIYGLYGGPKENFPEAGKALETVIKHNYQLNHPIAEWNWKNSDMSFQAWYNNFGYQIDFDMLHVIEWDLLFFESIEKLYSHVPANSLAITGLTRLKNIQKIWYWTRNDIKKAEWNQLMADLRREFSYDQEPCAMIGPGVSFPKEYLERIKNYKIPDLSNDEIRIPLLAQIHKFPMVDTGFFKKWFSRREFRYFNSNSMNIETAVMQKQLSKHNGRRVFHPCYQTFSFDELKSLYNSKVDHQKSFRLKNLIFKNLQ